LSIQPTFPERSQLRPTEILTPSSSVPPSLKRTIVCYWKIRIKIGIQTRMKKEIDRDMEREKYSH